MKRITIEALRYTITLDKLENKTGYCAVLQNNVKGDILSTKYRYLYFESVEEAVKKLISLEENA